MDAILTVQHYLGFQIDVADQFPMVANLPNATPQEPETDQPLQYILQKDLSIQMPGMKDRLVPAGTVVQSQHGHELLFCPTNY